MINNRLISSNAVIAKIIADLDLKETEIPITNMKEWIGEGLEKIGAIQQLEHKNAVLPVVNHQVSLPCDLHQLGQVAYSTQPNNGWIAMRKSTSSYGIGKTGNCNSNPQMYVQDSLMYPLVKNMFNLTTDMEALAKLNEDPNLRITLSTLLNVGTINTDNGRFNSLDSMMFSRDLQYTTKPGYILTTNRCGYVKIAYYAIITDDDGMPMIPDNTSYFEALYWYVTMKLMYPKKLKGQISQNDYYDIRNSYNFYRKQAYSDAMMPTVDDMQSIQNNWNKLYPELDDHETFFSTTGERQVIYNQD